MKKIIFLCGARDFHAIDWYKSAKTLNPKSDISILTDLIAGEGFDKIINNEDKVHKLLILDNFLFRFQSSFGDKWRNLLKLLVLPLQIILLKKFAKNNPNSVYHAHSMYYLVLARAARVEYVGTPQGSDILVKPYRSIFFKYFSIYGLKGAKYITVDSESMEKGVRNLTNRDAIIIQNGIDLLAIKNKKNILLSNSLNNLIRKNILSIRGFTELYRIHEILIARENLTTDIDMAFIYPFYDDIYKSGSSKLIRPNDIDFGKVTRGKMYELFLYAKLVISIPLSDSSPRSVYEAIFCGCPVAIVYNTYYEELPDCMKSRIIIVDINKSNWLSYAIDEAERINRVDYIPSLRAIELFDQLESSKKIIKLLLD